jgi:hypothetical protein
LYGLKKAPRKWYLKFDRFMTEQGYSRCHSNHCVYFKKIENGSYIIFLLYVDGMLVSGSNMKDINVLKKKLANSFVMKDLGAAKKILSMQITRDRKNHKLILSQGEYIEKVLESFRMQNSKPVSTPVNSNLVQYLLQTDIQKRTKKIQWQIQTLHRDFSPGNPNRENQHILY